MAHKSDPTVFTIEGTNRERLAFEFDWRQRRENGEVTLTYNGGFENEDQHLGKFHLEDLRKLIFLLSSKDEQEEQLPVVKKLICTFEKRVKVKATKDIKAGDTGTFDIKLEIPKNQLSQLVAGLEEDDDAVWHAETSPLEKEKEEKAS